MIASMINSTLLTYLFTGIDFATPLCDFVRLFLTISLPLILIWVQVLVVALWTVVFEKNSNDDDNDDEYFEIVYYKKTTVSSVPSVDEYLASRRAAQEEFLATLYPAPEPAPEPTPVPEPASIPEPTEEDDDVDELLESFPKLSLEEPTYEAGATDIPVVIASVEIAQIILAIYRALRVQAMVVYESCTDLVVYIPRDMVVYAKPCTDIVVYKKHCTDLVVYQKPATAIVVYYKFDIAYYQKLVIYYVLQMIASAILAVYQAEIRFVRDILCGKDYNLALIVAPMKKSIASVAVTKIAPVIITEEACASIAFVEDVNATIEKDAIDLMFFENAPTDEETNEESSDGDNEMMAFESSLKKKRRLRPVKNGKKIAKNVQKGASKFAKNVQKGASKFWSAVSGSKRRVCTKD